MLTVAKILELLPEQGSLEIKKLEKMLKLSKKVERYRLGIAISALTKVGLLDVDNDETVKLSNIEFFISAKIRCSSKGYCFAVRDDGEEDIYIREQHLNHAWHGDRVLVKIEREALKRRSPEGSVVCILDRMKKRLLARLEELNGEIYAKPLDERIISKIELPELNNKYKKPSENIYEVEINKYPIGQYNAVGNILRELSLNDGDKGDIEIIKTKFSITEQSKPPKLSPKKPSEKRTNLLNQEVILFKSWLSEDSPPLMAVYSEPFKGGDKAWIHIPTVSERIAPGSTLDNWLRERAESKCLGDKWINLLSKSLISNSGFKTNEENDAITLEIDVDKNGEVINWEFYLSRIKPVFQVSDSILEAIYNRKPKSRTIPTILKPAKSYLKHIQNIIHLAEILNQNLNTKGLIAFNSKNINTDGLNDHLFVNPGREYSGWKQSLKKDNANSILSILATISNIILYKHLHSLKINMIYLSSNDIDMIQLNEIIKSAIAVDTKVELNENGVIELPKLLEALEGTENQAVIEKLIKNIIPDKIYRLYEPNNIDEVNDNGLNDFNNLYEAPWSSPGISYADILNQYIVIQLINHSNEKKSIKQNVYKDTINLKDITPKLINKNLINYLNSERTRAKSFRKGLMAILEARNIEKIIGSSVPGVITGVQSYGIFVEIDSFDAEGLVHVSTLDDDWYEYRSRQNMLVGRKNKKTYQLGDAVTIKILSVDLLKNQIDLEVQPHLDSKQDVK